MEVRVISAAVERVEALVRRGRFREDLYYRLNGVRIELPSLRERAEDIPLLAERFLAEMAPADPDAPPSSFSPRAMRELLRRPWPGNVRELRHLVERSLLFSKGGVLTPESLVFQDGPEWEEESRGAGSAPGPAGTTEGHFQKGLTDAGGAGPEPRSLREARDAAEAWFIRKRLLEAEGNVTEAARLCGVSRESLYRLLRKHGVPSRTGGSKAHGGGP